MVEIAPDDKEKFEKMMAGITVAEIGRVTDGEIFEVYGRGGNKVMSAAIAELKEAWQKPLRW